MDPKSEENEDLKKEEAGTGAEASLDMDNETDGADGAAANGETEPESSLDAMVQALEGDDENDDKSKDAKADDEQKEKTDKQEKEEGDPASKPVTDEDLTAPLPEDAKAETRERFDKLAGSYKEVVQQNETYVQENTALKRDVTDFQGLIEHSGATPQEFNDLVDYSHMVKSGNLEGALKLLDEQRNDIAMMLGKPVAGIDVLADHPDLKEQVEKYGMSDDVAAELAAARNQKAANEKAVNERNAQHESEQQTTAQQKAVFDQAQADIVKMTGEWSSKDIDYPAKYDKLMAKAEEIAGKYRPELWGQALQLYYESLSNVKAQETTRNNSKNEHRPLRSGGGAGGDHAPTSSLEAMEQALSA